MRFVTEVFGRARPCVLQQTAPEVGIASSYVDGEGCPVEDVAAHLVRRDERADEPGMQAIEAASRHEATTSCWYACRPARRAREIRSWTRSRGTRSRVERVRASWPSARS